VIPPRTVAPLAASGLAAALNSVADIERTIIRSVSYRNRYWVYRIESYRLLLYRPILRASLQVQHELLTGRIKQQIKGHSRQSPAARVARARGRPPRAGAPYDPGYGRGLEGWEKEDCNLIPASP